ncbi:MAG TPA: EscU/YscU/HrcU family type III secretion system export apparatus switch protein [Solirubrobacteraceae bacterium]|nr:EscU/YscU/HrcU family type III secretion system export apparatus switch protein [Solirubrobacteraceae bacterium]
MPERPPRERRAAALRYDAGDDAAPKLVATGRGHVAERIVAEARAAGVPVRDDAALAAALAGLDLGAQVPEELYRAVAEALAWSYRLDSRASH